MERQARIAVADCGDSTLLAALRALPGRPEVRTFDSLYEGVEPLVAFRPDVLFVGSSAELEDLPGALRLVRHLLHGLGTVLVVPAAREVELAPLAQRAGASLLVWPPPPGEQGSALERAIRGGDRPRDEVFLDLARGFADEINNPLLFLTGHLQLLQARLPDEAGREVGDQIAAALRGARRIQDAVERIRLLSRAAAGPRRLDPIDLAALTAAVLAAGGEAEPLLPLRVEGDAGGFMVRGDVDLLRAAVEHLLQVARDFRVLGLEVDCTLQRAGDAVRLGLLLRGSGLRDWRLPRTFEPYYLNRLLRGSSHGLSLFLVQTAVHGHGGQATARRQADGALALELTLPA